MHDKIVTHSWKNPTTKSRDVITSLKTSDKTMHEAAPLISSLSLLEKRAKFIIFFFCFTLHNSATFGTE